MLLCVFTASVWTLENREPAGLCRSPLPFPWAWAVEPNSNEALEADVGLRRRFDVNVARNCMKKPCCLANPPKAGVVGPSGVRVRLTVTRESGRMQAKRVEINR